MADGDKDVKGVGRAIGDAVKKALDDGEPGAGTGDGFFDRMGGHLKDIFVDADGDGTPDVFETPIVPKAPKPPVELTQVRDDAKVEDFLKNVLAQVGDKYQRGVENSLKDADPDRWDGSELVEWAANRAGVMINDGAANQYRQLAHHGGDMSVEDALRTPGALLYEFTGDPVNGKPTRASTAISLGDGRIIDIDPVAGVRIVDAADFKFTHAGVMHGFTDAHDPGPGAVAVVHNALVEHGIEVPDATSSTPDAPRGLPKVPDTPDITLLADRAAQLRTQLLEQARSAERVELEDQIMDLGKKRVLADEGVEKSQIQIDDHLRQAKENRAEADDLDRKAQEAEEAGRPREAEELREQAAKDRNVATVSDQLAERATADIVRFKAEHAEFERQQAPLVARSEKLAGDRQAAEKAIDAIEDRARFLREANGHRQEAADLERQAAALRAEGKTTDADALARDAASATANATAARAQADAQVIDETALGTLGATPTVTPTPPAAPEPVPAPPPAASEPQAQAAPLVDIDIDIDIDHPADVARELLEARQTDHREDVARVERLARQEEAVLTEIARTAPASNDASRRLTELKDRLGEPIASDELMTLDGTPRVKAPEEKDPAVREQLLQQRTEVEAEVQRIAAARAPDFERLKQVQAERKTAEAEEKRSAQAVDEQQVDVSDLSKPTVLPAGKPATTPLERAAELEKVAGIEERGAMSDRHAATERRELSDLRDERADDLRARATAADERAADIGRQVDTSSKRADELGEEFDRFTQEAARLEAQGDDAGAQVMRDRAQRSVDLSTEHAFHSGDLKREVEIVQQQAADDRASADRLAKEADLLDQEAAALDQRAGQRETEAKAARAEADKLDDPIDVTGAQSVSVGTSEVADTARAAVASATTDTTSDVNTPIDEVPESEATAPAAMEDASQVALESQPTADASDFAAPVDEPTVDDGVTSPDVEV